MNIKIETAKVAGILKETLNLINVQHSGINYIYLINCSILTPTNIRVSVMRMRK